MKSLRRRHRITRPRRSVRRRNGESAPFPPPTCICVPTTFTSLRTTLRRLVTRTFCPRTCSRSLSPFRTCELKSPAICTESVRRIIRRSRKSAASSCRRSGGRISLCICRPTCRNTNISRIWNRSDGSTRNPTSCRNCRRRISPLTPKSWRITRRGTVKRRSSSPAPSHPDPAPSWPTS